MDKSSWLEFTQVNGRNMDRKAQYGLVAANADSDPIGGHRVSNRVGTGREL